MIEVIITSSILIAVILLIRFVFKGKLSRFMRYSLWAVVALRLLIPISLSAPISIMNAIDTEPIQKVFIGETINIVADQTAEPSSDEVLATPTNQTPVISEKIDYVKLIWFTGIIAVVMWFLITNMLFYIKLRKNRIELDFDCKLKVYQADFLQSPCIFGIIRPAIYVTSTVLESEDKTKHVIMHEMCHYAHLDHIWSLVRTACLSLYWFNPLVWIGACCSRSDCELACDELAVKRLGEGQSLDYGKTLVSLIAIKSVPISVMQVATTMASGKRGIKNRLNMIVKSPKTLIPSLIIVVAILLTMIGCTFTGATQKFTAEDALNSLSTSVTYAENKLSFTLPLEYKQPENWNIQIAGRIQTEGTDGMSVHLFEKETQEKSWQAGKTYNIDVDGQNYTELTMYVDLDGQNIDIDLLEFIQQMEYNQVNITFPVYNNSEIVIDGETRNIAEVEPFIASVILPKGWEVRNPTDAEKNIIMGTFYSQMVITDGNKVVAGIGYNSFDPNFDADSVDKSGYYMTVYPDLRLGSMIRWDPYTAVKTTDIAETGIAEVEFLDPDEIDNHPGAMPDVPHIFTKGILSYDKEIKAYIGLMFQPDTVTDSQIQTIAQSVSLTKATKDTTSSTESSEVSEPASLIYPVEGKITSPFGFRTILENRKFHTGIDIAASYGTEIKAAADGKVIKSQNDGVTGMTIWIEHSNGIETQYAHCSKLIAREGDTVKQGDIIAQVGSTGMSTGDHLGFEVKKDGEFIDPLTMLK